MLKVRKIGKYPFYASYGLNDLYSDCGDRFYKPIDLLPHIRKPHTGKNPFFFPQLDLDASCWHSR